MSVNQEGYDYVPHYDPVVAEIIEPLDTIRIENLVEAIPGNGIAVDGSVFMDDADTIQLATVQGVAGAAIDFLDDINFDTDSGIKFGAGQKLDEHLQGTIAVTWSGAIGNTAGTVFYEKIGRTVTLTLSTFAAAFTSATTITTTINVLPTDLLPIENVSNFALVKNNGAAATGFFSVSDTGVIVMQQSTGAFSAGSCGLERSASITYISDV